MHRRSAAILPSLLAAGWLLSLLAPLLSPGRALANRDIPLFHLPLRAAFRELAAHRAADLEPVAARRPAPALEPQLRGVLSAELAGASRVPPPTRSACSPSCTPRSPSPAPGGWRGTSAAGAGRRRSPRWGTPAAAPISRCSAPSPCSAAWPGSPGSSLWADQALRAPAGQSGWWRPALLAGGALALQLLNGEPSTVVMSGLGVLALAASAAGRRPAAPRASRGPRCRSCFAVALAAVQLLPTLGRLADSPRKGLPASAGHALVDAARAAGRDRLPALLRRSGAQPGGASTSAGSSSDRDYPYVESIYPGLLLAVLGAAALIRWPHPPAGGVGARRRWPASSSPSAATTRSTRRCAGRCRVLAVLRFPEKFAILAVLALVFAGALGWQRLLDERRGGAARRRPIFRSPWRRGRAGHRPGARRAAAAVGAAASPSGWIATHGAPDLGARRPAAPSPTCGRRAGPRWRPPPRSPPCSPSAAGAAPPGACWSGLAVALLAADLWHYGHGLVRTLPAAAYTVPPPLAALAAARRDRIFVQPPPAGAPEIVPRAWGRPADAARPHLHRPAGALLGAALAHPLCLQRRLRPDAHRLGPAGADDPRRRVGAAADAPTATSASGTSAPCCCADAGRRAADGGCADPARDAAPGRRTPTSLPRFRFVPRVSFHPDIRRRAGRPPAASAWQVARHEQLRAAGRSRPRRCSFRARRSCSRFADEGGGSRCATGAGRGRPSSSPP